jgi:tetratricopeptide (TPR) repeat protein
MAPGERSYRGGDPMNPAHGELAAKLRQAVAFHQQGQLARARAIYREILAREPRHFDALHLSGVVAIQTKDPVLALELIGKAIDVHPGSAAAHCNQGSAFEALGQLDAALASFDRAISIDAGHLESQFNRANVLHKRERFESALAGYDRTLALQPTLAAAHFNRGKVLRQLQRWDGARQSFERAIGLEPGHAEAYLSLGLVLKELQQLKAAVASYDRAIAIKPDFVEAHSNRGNVLKRLEQWDAALASYDRAITLKPDFAEVHFNRGVVLHELGRFEEASSSYTKAVAVRPEYAEAHSNRGNALTELNHLAEALASYERAVAINPNYAPAHFNWAIALLLAGDLERGFREYEWRWKNEAGSVINEKREFQRPLWLGAESPAGKTILLYGEQGLGDTIQFCRYAKLLADLNARVILEVKAPLRNLLSNLEGVSEVVAKGGELPGHDFQCPLLSLPLAFKTTLASIPSPGRYLSSDAPKMGYWQARLGRKVRPHIGLVWSGNAQQRNDHKRSIPLEALMAALPAKFQYVCLQTDVRDSDRQVLPGHRNILNFGDELDFEHTAALCECLDLVISVDTSLAHLSAALGKTTWILLPFNPDWRWLLDRTDSPWYPTAKLYRQPRIGDWTGVFKQVSHDLIDSFASWSPQL